RAGMHRLHDLDHGEAALGIKPRGPRLFDAGADLRIIDGAVVRIEHRDEAGVGGALHVVLPAHRMEPRAGTAALSADQAERANAARVVGAVHVLRYAMP